MPSVYNVRSSTPDFSSKTVKKNAAYLLLAACGQHDSHAQSECWWEIQTADNSREVGRFDDIDIVSHFLEVKLIALLAEPNR